MVAWIENDPAFQEQLQGTRRTWLVTGAAGFIGSHLVETLLRAGQTVRGLDNFATGHRRNLDEVRSLVGEEAWQRFDFREGDIRDIQVCEAACADIEVVLHQAALGSVPRSIADPLTSNAVNVGGFLNMLDAARRSGVRNFVYAASSSTYGDEANLPKIEERIGRPLSPYAVTKLVNEIYADVFSRTYGFQSIGLRYFNVFGPRQDPGGAYAAVIPKWTASMIADSEVTINGDGQTSRDFCYVANAVQANLRSALAPVGARDQVYNVALGDRTDLLALFELIREALSEHQIVYRRNPVMGDFRPGDVRHSQAAIDKAQTLLGYRPSHRVAEGIRDAMGWYVDFFRAQMAQTG